MRFSSRTFGITTLFILMNRDYTGNNRKGPSAKPVTLPLEFDHLCLRCIQWYCEEVSNGVLRSYWTALLTATRAAYLRPVLLYGGYRGTAMDNGTNETG